MTYVITRNDLPKLKEQPALCIVLGVERFHESLHDRKSAIINVH